MPPEVESWFACLGSKGGQVHRHGRACPGHPRLRLCAHRKTWMPGTSPGMTPSFVIVGASRTYAWLATALPSAACAAANRAIGTRYGEQETESRPISWQNATEAGSPP